jgi:alpha-beta hydrolase superfamily lysophospholipase
MLTKETLTRAEARVPRYTSYPTAPHFTKAVGPLQVARGMASAFAWGQQPYGPLQQRISRQYLLTGSRAHFEDEGRWVEARPELATGGVSWGWIQAFAESERIVRMRLPRTFSASIA